MQFNCFMHIPCFEMPTIRQVSYHIQQGDYAFSIDLKDAYIFQLLSIMIIFMVCFQWKVLLFGLATTPRIFHCAY